MLSVVQVGDNSFDLPDANVLIQVSYEYALMCGGCWMDSLLLPVCLPHVCVDLGPRGVQETGSSEIRPHPKGKET